jgi:hypothetical protein
VAPYPFLLQGDGPWSLPPATLPPIVAELPPSLIKDSALSTKDR